MFLRTTWYHRSNTIAITIVIGGLLFPIPFAHAQQPYTKIRIANSAMSVTSLPLLAAREWKLFHERGLDVEIILMSPAISVPAIVSGEIDYFAGRSGSGQRKPERTAAARRVGFFQ